jgi:hypothetical protein
MKIGHFNALAVSISYAYLRKNPPALQAINLAGFASWDAKADSQKQKLPNEPTAAATKELSSYLEPNRTKLKLCPTL